ncbi:hypothetical protein BREVNS_2006 [Brevinematales bacterium NS]|nr:hypothetical protein BREVNS_2006 [Brevinematales bacterium NS]
MFDSFAKGWGTILYQKERKKASFCVWGKILWEGYFGFVVTRKMGKTAI